MKKLFFACLLLVLAACSETDETTPARQPTTEAPAPAQNVEGENGTAVETSPVAQEPAQLTDEEAITIIKNLIDNLQEATENAGYDTTIETIQQAWAPYVTPAYFEGIAEYLSCDFEYCGAYYQIPNSVDFGWQRTFDFVSDDTFTTEALVPNLGDSVGLFSLLQHIEVTQDDGAWKINMVDFEPRDMHLSKDEVIPYLAQMYDIHINDFYLATLDHGEFRYDVYVFTHPEDNEEYFIDSYTGTMYGRAFFEEFTGDFIE